MCKGRGNGSVVSTCNSPGLHAQLQTTQELCVWFQPCYYWETLNNFTCLSVPYGKHI